jgi:hypothetical protein
VEHFGDLPADDRARILSLVRNLSICHAVMSARKGQIAFERVTLGGAPLSGSIPRSAA